MIGMCAVHERRESIWPPICWVVSDGHAGTENQSLGLAEAMGLAPQVMRLRMRRFLRELVLHQPWGRGVALAHYDVRPPWPDLLVGTGRASVIALLYVKRASRGRTFTVQIQTPVVPFRRFDCVIVPDHDEVHGDNVLAMTGSLHRVTPELLRAESGKWAARFGDLPRPHVAVLLGGSSGSYRLGGKEIAEIAGQLAALARSQGAGLLITASRRTGAANVATLRELLQGHAAIIWSGEGENPYYGMLGLADAFIVTCESVNMICEACSTGRPVHIVRLPGHSRKLQAFHRSLMDSGRIRPFLGALEHWTYPPLLEKERIATLVRRRYEARRAAPRDCGAG
jgi:mitochondrial fission protein ELM1